MTRTDLAMLDPNIEHHPVPLSRAPRETIHVKARIRLAPTADPAFWRAARIAHNERPANRTYTSILREWGWIDTRGRAVHP